MNPFKKEHKQLGIFITAGFPEFDSLPKQIEFLNEKQVDFIEVGMPFSDPMADGPTIQKSSEKAIANGMDIQGIIDQLSQVKSEAPLVLMGYLNPVLNYGLDNFLSKCKELNIKGVLLPDISIEIYERMYRQSFEKHGVQCIFIITEHTPSDRRKLIARNSKNGFVYLTASVKTTGVDSKFSVISEELITEIKQDLGDIPLMIGFGIKSKEDIEQVHHLADGAIIGSAYISALEKNNERTFIESLR